MFPRGTSVDDEDLRRLGSLAMAAMLLLVRSNARPLTCAGGDHQFTRLEKKREKDVKSKIIVM